jgi:dTDP-3-amino-2,3,6-trideoxy-4-keto-D-glucose/dTDP-3-amino-3,4,6-trideoxy-alpha-D-glucose/dTDP-2,6-dideoxy-D-kanosamine transaminase
VGTSPSNVIPFNDLSRIPDAVASEVNAAISRVVSSGWFVMGPEHNALEQELASYLGVNDVVLLGNGTDALELALAAIGVGRGDLVLTVANAGAYSSIAARLLGAIPVYCDVEPDTLLMSAELVRAAIESASKKPTAIVVTHLFGAMAPIEQIVAVAHSYGIPVVEDCAQSIGARSDGRQSGTFGDIATTSFYPTKNLGALGDGGAVFTDNAELANAVRRMRQYGWDSKYHIAYDHGRNSRMDEMQAAIVRAKLPYLDRWNARRRAIHSRYEEASSPAARMLNSSAESFTAHLAVLVVGDREAFREELKRAGIGTDVHYPIPDHRQDFPTNPPLPVSLPITEHAAQTIVSIPMFPELADDEVERITVALSSYGIAHG